MSDATFRPIRSYGEFALRLEKISYDVCTSQKITEVNDEGELVDTITYTKKTDQVYDQRVCQYNFPVTTPYFIQKGTALSSRPDDAEKLGNFKKLDGRDILEVSGIETLTDISVSKVFSQFTEK